MPPSFFTNGCDQGRLCRWDWLTDHYALTAKQSAPSLYTGDGQVALDAWHPTRVWGFQYKGGPAQYSDDGGQTWKIIASDQSLEAIAVAQGAPSLVFGVSYNAFLRRNDGTSGNDTPWTVLEGGAPWLLQSAVTKVYPVPYENERAFIAGTGVPSLLATTDTGNTWVQADRPGAADGLPDTAVRSVLARGDVVLVGTDIGLFVSWNFRDPNVAWHEVPTPFGRTPITHLAFAPGMKVRAFTRGRGAWSADFEILSQFSDVDGDQWARQSIEALAKSGITGGCAKYPSQFCPDRLVQRDQMAVFLLLAMHGPGYVPPPATGVFTDVPGSHWAGAWMEQLKVEGVTSGCSAVPAMYCPSDNVTRAQMAVFLLRAKHGPSYVPPPATGDFLDVPANMPTAPWIEQLAREGVTSGCSITPKYFCPDASVDRSQMAVFLGRAFNLPGAL